MTETKTAETETRTATVTGPPVEKLVEQLRASKQFFDRSTATLDEDDATFAPVEGMMTVAQQVAHVAQTYDWFRTGAFGERFEMDFEKMAGEIMSIESLTAAREWLDRAVDALCGEIESAGREGMAQPMPAGPPMNGRPRHTLVGGVVDHTAHHRGALTVYVRLRGKVPAMPYM